MEELSSMVTRFRHEYELAADGVAADVSRRWEFLWDVVLRSAARDLLQPDADRFAVLRRLEEWAAQYRRALTDPVRLLGSLELQDTVVQHLTALERECTKTTDAGRRPHHPQEVTATSAAWNVVLQHPTAFLDWPISAALPTWQLANDLYHNPHDFVGAAVHLWGATTEHLVTMAALCDASRFLDMRRPDDAAYRREVFSTLSRPWIDVEDVLVTHCGYPPYAGEDYRAWREPIRLTEEALRRMLLGIAADTLVVHWLVRWLREMAGCAPDLYMWTRYPPSFVSLVCNAFGKASPGSFPLLDPERVRESVSRSEMHPQQNYSMWVRFGIFEDPDEALLTQGWDATDHRVLQEEGGRFTSRVSQHWAVKLQ